MLNPCSSNVACFSNKGHSTSGKPVPQDDKEGRVGLVATFCSGTSVLQGTPFLDKNI